MHASACLFCSYPLSHVHTYTHTYIHTYNHTHIHTYTHTHMHIDGRQGASLEIAQMCINIRIYMLMLLHAYRHTHMHAYIHAQVHEGSGIPSDPHVIKVQAALDSRDKNFPENLPLAPWF